MSDKVNILISIDKEFADALYYLKKHLHGTTKGAQSKTVEDALRALAQQSKYEIATKKIAEGREEIKILWKEVGKSATDK